MDSTTAYQRPADELGWVCGRCGAETSDLCDDDAVAEWRYCPWCGREIKGWREYEEDAE